MDEWTLELPTALKSHLNILTQNINSLTESFLPLEEHMSTKVGKADMLAALRSKVDRATFDDKSNETMDVVNTFNEEQTDRLDRLQTSVNKLKEQTSMLAAQATTTKNLSDIFQKLKNDTARMEERLQQMQDRVEANDVRYDGRFSDGEKIMSKHKTRIDHVEDVAAKVSTKIDGVHKTLSHELMEQKQKLEPALTRLAAVEGKVKSFSNDMSAMREAAVAEAKAYTNQSIRMEKQQRSQADAEIVARFNDLDDRMKKLETDMYELTKDVTTQQAELRDYIVTTGTEIKKAVTEDVKGMSTRMEMLNRELDNGLETLRGGVQDMTTLKTDVHDGFRRIDDDVATETQARVALQDKMRESINDASRRSEERDIALGEKVSTINNDLEQMSADWQMQWEERALDVDDRLDRLKMIATELVGGLATEENTRSDEVGSLVRAVADLKGEVAAELDNKANWDDVRRSLWLKADKADLPMAVTTRGLGGDRKAIADPNAPPDELDGTDVLDVGYSDPLGHSLSGTGYTEPNAVYTPRRSRPVGSGPRKPPDMGKTQPRPKTSGVALLGVASRNKGISPAHRAWGSRETWEFT